jgi:hypothetical protein
MKIDYIKLLRQTCKLLGIVVLGLIVWMATLLVRVTIEHSAKSREIYSIVGKDILIKNTNFQGKVLKIVQGGENHSVPVIYLVRVFKGKDAPKMYEEVQFFVYECELLPE